MEPEPRRESAPLRSMQRDLQKLVAELGQLRQQKRIYETRLDSLELIEAHRGVRTPVEVSAEIDFIKGELDALQPHIRQLQEHLSRLPGKPPEHNQESYEQQLRILQAHRRTLAHYLEQKASFSVGHVPAHIAAGIQEARQEIAQIKRVIRGWGYSVDNNPMDGDNIDGIAESHNVAPLKEEPPASLVEPTPSAIPSTSFPPIQKTSLKPPNNPPHNENSSKEKPATPLEGAILFIGFFIGIYTSYKTVILLPVSYNAFIQMIVFVTVFIVIFGGISFVITLIRKLRK